MRIVFFGTPEFAIPSLNALFASEDKVVAVVTQPDKRKGRGHIFTPPPVKELALKRGIEVIQPKKLKEVGFINKISNLKPDLIIVVAYGKILPVDILMLPAFGCINVHASLLPKYRGAAPIQWALINGETKTGVTIIMMDEGLDTGDILFQKEIEILEEDNAETLSKKLSELGAFLLIETIRKIKEGSIERISQVGTPSYAPLLKKEDGLIDWSKSAKDIFNFVRGMYPWPCAYCYLNRERIKIIKVKVIEGTGIPGRIEKLNKDFIVGTGKGLISVIELQPDGRRVMTAKEFLQGRRLEEGAFFNEQ